MSQPNEDITMNWAAMWHYFQSDIMNDSGREFTLLSFMPDAIRATQSYVQFEILEHAPQWVIERYKQYINPDTMRKLEEVHLGDKMTEIDEDEFISLYKKIKESK